MTDEEYEILNAKLKERESYTKKVGTLEKFVKKLSEADCNWVIQYGNNGDNIYYDVGKEDREIIANVNIAIAKMLIDKYKDAIDKI